jgi:hypothetical protein
LIGVLSFDPLAFAEAEPKKQVETLIDLIGRKAFDELAYLRKEAYEERTDINRDLKRTQAQYDALGTPEPLERVSVADLVSRYESVRAKLELRAEWEAIQGTIDAALRRQAEIVEEASKLPDGDVDEIQRQIAESEATNRAAQRYEDWKELGTQVEDYRHASEELTTRIEEVDANRQKLIESAELPVDGLTFDEEGVQFNGVPFEQASAAERLKVSTAMAMALNPELKVICIRDASLLDDDSKMALIEMAKAHDYQIWYEVVGTSVDEAFGVIIEDGEVA